MFRDGEEAPKRISCLVANSLSIETGVIQTISFIARLSVSVVRSLLLFRDAEETQKLIPCIVANYLSMETGGGGGGGGDNSKYLFYCTTYDMSQSFIS